MKKLLIIFILHFLFCMSALSKDDYDNLYENAKPFESRLYNDIDPFEDEDYLKYAYNPYPLFRTSVYLYFKDYTIAPGYYSLIARKLKGEYYMFFKQGGKVKFIIPVVKKEMTPINFYNADIPQRKKTKWQKFATGVSNKFYQMSVRSQKMPPPKSFIKVESADNYIIVYLYYGEDKFTALFKRTQY